MSADYGGRPARRLRRQYVIAVFLVSNLLIASSVFTFLSGKAPALLTRARPAPRSLLAGTGYLSSRIYLPAVAGGKKSERQATFPAAAVPAELAAPSPHPGPDALQAKIEIVWPHDNAGLREADLANITVYLLAGGGRPVPCAAEYTVRLWRAVNTGAARPVAVGHRRMFSSGGHTFPVWDFNDVDVSPGRDPANRVLFYATVDGQATRHNVWIHASDGRTVFPRADVPQAVTSAQPSVYDARIEIVWPHHHTARAGQNRLANVTAYLFDAATGLALAPVTGAARPDVRLHWSVNNEIEASPAGGLPGTSRAELGGNGVHFLAWDFNDVDVSPGSNSVNKLHFWLSVEDSPALTNLWTHGAAAPTLFPLADAPPSCE